MGAVRKLAELARGGSPEGLENASELIQSLRTYYHSLREEERDEVIELLGSMPSPDAARELIQLYDDCQWRRTRLKIIRALGHFPAQRSLEFLFKLARDAEDIPVAETAIRTLGLTHHVLAARFLTHAYRKCPETLKPAIVGAIGQIPDRTLAQEFLKELPLALAEGKIPLLRSLALTLGELKVADALPALENLASRDDIDRSVALSALVSIGKISRDPQALSRREEAFSQDLFESQLFRSVRTQIQFRAQWKLEDYLRKLFEGPEAHRSLPYELNFFDPADVKEGLKLYAGPQHLDRLCQALSKVDFPEVASWYSEFFPLDQLGADQAVRVLDSIACHLNVRMQVPLEKLRAVAFAHPMEPVFIHWLEAAASCLPEADSVFKDFFSSKIFKELPESRKILAINALVGFGLGVQTHPARLQAVGRLLDYVLENETHPPVQTRVLRAFGHLGYASPKAKAFIKAHLHEPAFTASCLNYLEACPEKGALSGHSKLADKHLPALLRVMTADEDLEDHRSVLEEILRKAFSKAATEEVRHEALRFLGRHPLPSCLGYALECLKAPERLQLDAVITLKSFQDGSVADAIAPLLESKLHSVSGRALDTLTSLPGMRAKRLVIDHLKAHADDLDICDKIARCLEPPETGTEYFVAIIDEVLELFPQHPHSDNLIALRDRMKSAADATGRGGLPKGTDVRALDAELEKRIPGYEDYEESAKSALRSAELPYLHPEQYDDFVDKSASILQYCKAVDMVLERDLGRKLLFPRLESSLHEFQNTVHAATLNESQPSAERVIKLLSLEGHFTAQSLPLHKMTMLAQGILSGRIVNERFKTLDGLRAWAVVLLLFTRKPRPILHLKPSTDDAIIVLCKKLMALQDVRNPAAHRQTVQKLGALDEVRNESLAVLRSLKKLL